MYPLTRAEKMAEAIKRGAPELVELVERTGEHVILQTPRRREPAPLELMPAAVEPYKRAGK